MNQLKKPKAQVSIHQKNTSSFAGLSSATYEKEQRLTYTSQLLHKLILVLIMMSTNNKSQSSVFRGYFSISLTHSHLTVSKLPFLQGSLKELDTSNRGESSKAKKGRARKKIDNLMLHINGKIASMLDSNNSKEDTPGDEKRRLLLLCGGLRSPVALNGYEDFLGVERAVFVV